MFVLGVDLIVKDLEVRSIVACGEAVHDKILGFNEVLVGLCFEQRL